MHIGDGSSLSAFSFVGGSGGVDIGKRVLIGQRVSIHSQNHNYDDPHRPIAHQRTTEQDGVTLGERVRGGRRRRGHPVFPAQQRGGRFPARVVKTRGATDEG